ncbi:MAG TPA: NADH:ubiquinone reductase (Na(+)-transporting) subunit F [Gammaproteobacteria bacterium]
MILQLIVPIAIFTGIVLALSALVLVVSKRLRPSGWRSVDVNGQRVVEVEAGRRLLWALADNGIFLPAACGGRGTCGQCRVTVTAGAGHALPTEAVHIDADELQKGVRLACAVRVVEEMKIVVPAAILDVRRWSCEVESTRSVATYVKEIVLKMPDTEKLRFTAGAYVMVEAPSHEVAFHDFDIDARYLEDWRRSGLLKLESTVDAPVLRAYSLANPPQQDDRLVLLVRIAVPPASAPPGAPPGQVSSYLFGLKPGETIAVSGPFGEFQARETDKEMVFIAGGVGIAPIRSIILDQLTRETARKMSLWYGARDKDDLCYFEELEEAAKNHPNFEVQIALSAPRDTDEWSGYVGFIHSVVDERYLAMHPSPGEVEYYLCGPPVMSAAVIGELERRGVDRSRITIDEFGG